MDRLNTSDMVFTDTRNHISTYTIGVRERHKERHWGDTGNTPQRRQFQGRRGLPCGTQRESLVPQRVSVNTMRTPSCVYHLQYQSSSSNGHLFVPFLCLSCTIWKAGILFMFAFLGVVRPMVVMGEHCLPVITTESPINREILNNWVYF